MELKRLGKKVDKIAPDGMEGRMLITLKEAELNHWQLAPNTISSAVIHKTIKEIWYCVAGKGKFWRKSHDEETDIEEIYPGTALSILPGTTFQFRNDDEIWLEFIIITIPPWSEDQEASIVKGIWE